MNSVRNFVQKGSRSGISNRVKKQLKILVTAGPTQEPIDPARFISNYSTGKMGYTIAKKAQDRGHRVTLISGPTHLTPPVGVKFIPVVTTSQMREAVRENFFGSDCLIMTAAVSDFRPKITKIKKIKRSPKGLCLELKENPDILSELGKRKRNRILVGFSLETENLIKSSLTKLKHKKLDLIVGSKIGKGFSPFGENKASGVIINKDGKIESFSKVSKEKLAGILLDCIENYISVKCNQARGSGGKLGELKLPGFRGNRERSDRHRGRAPLKKSAIV
jgi:phosphopantothenoylcysteine decarboxylase/phosphopantothenate--cysteine ligase